MFGKNYSLNLKEHGTTAFNIDPKSRDVNDISGVFRGEWTIEGPQLFINRNNSLNVNDSSSTSTNDFKNKGNLLIQLKSIVIRNLPSLRYVYGIMRIYASLPSIAGDMLIPVQGLLEVESNTLTLLSTPQKTQFIAMSAGNAHHKNASDLEFLLMNHTALHDDIRRKHDERMHIHALYVNSTSSSDVNNSKMSLADDFVNVSGKVSNPHRRLSWYSAQFNDTYPPKKNTSHHYMRLGNSSMYRMNSSNPYNEKDLSNLYNARAGILKSMLQSRWPNRTAYGQLKAHFGPGKHLLTYIFTCKTLIIWIRMYFFASWTRVGFESCGFG